MESTTLSVGKSALSGALGYAGSAVAEEVALQLGVRDDQAFIRDELEMMQAFLMAAHDERDDNRVVRTWVKQVRDVAYDVEDSLQEFAVRLATLAWWRVACSLLVGRRVAKKMKELRAKVEDVSQRNIRYHLIKGSRSKSARGTGQSTMTGGAVEMSGAHEVNRQRDQAKVDLARLINRKDDEVRVIGVCGTGGDLKEMSILTRAYEDLKARKKFECYAWISLAHPFSPVELLQSIVEQFYVNFLQEAREGEKATMEGQALRRMGMVKGDDLIDEFKRYVNDKSYLILLDDLHTVEEWNGIKAWFPNNKKGSRIMVRADKAGVASLCVGPANAAPEHKQLVAAGETLYAFYEKGSQDGTDSMVAGSSSIADTTASNIYLDNKILPRTETNVAAFKESQLIGRGKEKSDLIKLTANEDNQQLEIISVWGMGGLGKTTLVRDVYQSQQLSAKFEKRACITIMRPFNLGELLKSLASQFGYNEYNKAYLEGKKYLIVLDDLSSTNEWDEIIPHLPKSGTASRIVVTTRIESIEKHCSKNHENIYHLQPLGDKDAHNLFTEKVFNKITDLDEQYPELVEQANLVLKKCSGLPLAIVTIGGFLANQPKTVLVWRKLNEHISAKLEMNQELETIRMVLIKSYDGLPYHLKSCFLYLSIFPEDYKIGWRRLVRRWIAEGYAREVRGKSAEEIAESYFMELISRSMLLPCQESIHSRKGIDSCQLHDLIREIGISKSMEENLVLILERGCSSNIQATVRHLVVGRSWMGDQNEFESMVDMSRLRSLTVFGLYRTFFISDKMKLLRVLDLEGSSDVLEHGADLRHIGKLLHLRYLSVRGCQGIIHLPNSMGNLRQLHTLDARDTQIVKLPKSIVKLRKLKYLHAGSIPDSEEDERKKGLSGLALPALYLACVLPFATYCGCCVDPVSHLDFRTLVCCVFLPTLVMNLSPNMNSVLVPRGMGKLRSLHTLGIVNISRGKDILRDIRRLTQLRKLRVDGINKRNYQAFCMAIADLKCLESLSIRSEEEQGLCGRLDGMYSASESVPNLRSLRLYGNLTKLPQWIKNLKNLVKLKLRSTRISEVDDTMEVLGKLPNQAILYLWDKSFVGGEIRFSFHREAFRSLLLLELAVHGNVKSVKFEEGAAPKLELLQYLDWGAIGSFSGLPHLPSLKQVLIDSSYNDDEFIEDLQGQLARNPNLPVLKGV